MSLQSKTPVAPGLFVASASGAAHLTANKCGQCGEIYFPKESLCLRCGHADLSEVALSRQGELYSYTVIRQQPPIYKGPVPYAIGIIQLPEKVRMTCLLTNCEFTHLKIGMPVELVVEKLHDDDQGNEVVCHKFRPIA